MRKILCLIVLSAGLAGCGSSASQNEFLKHDTMYRNWDHMRFSWGGHRNINSEEIRQSVDEEWWGRPIPVAPVR